MNIKRLFLKLKNLPGVDYYLVAILSAFFGFFRITHQSLWNDESISIIWAAKKSLAWIWENVPKADLHPPLYYSVLHFWQLTFGDSVFSIRALSAIFFIGSSLLIYHLIKLFFSSRRLALLTALIFMTNLFAVMYAQEVRSYAMLIFFVLLNSLFFYKIVYQKIDSKKNYLFYFFTALILIYSNILALFVLLSHFIIILLTKNFKLIKYFSGLYFVLFILFLPAFKIIKSANDYDYSYYYSERFNVFLKTIVVVSGFIGGKINIWNGKRQIYGLLAASLVAYGALFSCLVYKFKQINKFLLSFFLIAFVLIMTAAHIKFPVPDPKYFYVVFPFFILLLGNLLYLTKKKKYLLIIFGLILAFNLVFLYDYYFVKQYEKENWQSVVSMIEKDFKQETNKTALSISPVVGPHTTWEYYSHNLMPAAGALKYGNSAEGITKALDEANNPPKDIIYLSRFIWELYDPSDNIRLYFENHGYKKIAEFKDTKVEYWKYVKQ